MRLAEVADQPAERIGGQRRERDEVEGAGVQRLHRGDRCEHRVAVAGELARGPTNIRPGVRQLDAAAEPVEQPHAELGLQPAGSRRRATAG